MPTKLVRNKLGYGQKKAYIPGLPTIMEERGNWADEPDSISPSESYSSEAHSDEWWMEEDHSDETNEIVTTVLKNEENYTIYSALLSISSILQHTEPQEFKHYQAVFNRFLKDYPSYLNNVHSFLNEIKIIHSTQSPESVSCCFIFKKKAPVNSVTNKFILLMIHSAMQLDLASIQKIEEQLNDSINKESLLKVPSR
ncbi:hypothetical protein ACD661_15090 [Legionella lytica]|uniref:Ankyrin repeat protein n=1 Tax=Legionella lytica TaxID=96232 RepID=A0ABW8DAZ8_9GAMM